MTMGSCRTPKALRMNTIHTKTRVVPQNLTSICARAGTDFVENSCSEVEQNDESKLMSRIRNSRQEQRK